MILIFYLFDLLISINIGIPSFLFLYNLDKNKFVNMILFILLYVMMFRKGLLFSFIIFILYYLSKLLSFKYSRFKNGLVLVVYVSFLYFILNRSINVISIIMFFLMTIIFKVLKIRLKHRI